jgi:hypothetical protein
MAVVSSLSIIAAETWSDTGDIDTPGEWRWGTLYLSVPKPQRPRSCQAADVLGAQLPGYAPADQVFINTTSTVTLKSFFMSCPEARSKTLPYVDSYQGPSDREWLLGD